MTKKIGYISLEQEECQWLQAHLPAGGLKENLEKLFSGEFSTLMVETGAQDLPPSSADITVGDLTIQERSRTIRRGQQDIALTPKEFDILLFLAKNRGEVFTKEQIYQAVWGGSYVLDDSNIMAFIRKLRKKIEPNPDAPVYILTIWGIGYKFSDRV